MKVFDGRVATTFEEASGERNDFVFRVARFDRGFDEGAYEIIIGEKANDAEDEQGKDGFPIFGDAAGSGIQGIVGSVRICVERTTCRFRIVHDSSARAIY